MINNFDSTNEINPKEGNITLKKIIHLFLRQWYWFALCGAIGLTGAFVYNKLTVPQYSISSSILIPESSQGVDFKSMFQGSFNQPKDNIYNQIELITSYKNINQTLLNLNWRTSWYEKDFFVWRGIYKREPFDVQEASNYINPKGIKIYITPLSNDSYKVAVKGKTYKNNEEVNINFESTGQFGKPFINDQFNFTLLKKINSVDGSDGKYYFTFNDLNDATLSYQDRLNAVLKDKNSDIIVCSIQGEQPEKEGEFLNELIKDYIDGKMSFQNEAQRRSLDFINKQLTGISDSLNQAGTKFTEFKSRNNIVDLSAEGTLVMNNLKDIGYLLQQSLLQ